MMSQNNDTITVDDIEQEQMVINENRLIRKRKYVQGRLVRILNFLRTFDLETGIQSDIRARQNAIEELYTEFKLIQNTILVNSENEEVLEGLDTHYDGFDKVYFEARSHCDRLLTKEMTTVLVQEKAVANKVQVKLPEINVPKFDGDISTYEYFRDSFTAIVINHQDLSEIQKFHYLKGCLSDAPRRIVDRVEYTGAGFAIAWKDLEEKYNNPRYIVDKHVTGLFKLKGLVRDTASELREFVDTVNVHVDALEHLKQPVAEWSTLLNHLVLSKVTVEIRKKWEMTTDQKILPKFRDLIKFLEKRCTVLESIELTKKNFELEKPKKSVAHTVTNIATNNLDASNAMAPTLTSSCKICTENHEIEKCVEFLTLSIPARIRKVKASVLCMNCLKSGHMVYQCPKEGCSKCKKKHNILLHLEVSTPSPTPLQVPEQSSTAQVTNNLSAQVESSSSEVFLATAIVEVLDSFGNKHAFRALLDSASQSSFVSERLCHQLGLKKSHVSVPVYGISGVSSRVKHAVNAFVQSSVTNYSCNLEFYVLPNITGQLPCNLVDPVLLNIPNTVKLADPKFNVPRKIDILLGAEVFMKLFLPGNIDLGKNCPSLQNTVFGWVVSGALQHSGNLNSTICNMATIEHSLDDQLEKFWKIEEIDNQENRSFNMTKEEVDCEQHFADTVRRDETGRFVLKLPLKSTLSELGDSRRRATCRFLSLERKLSQNEVLRKQYVEFINEFIQLGHMEEVLPDDVSSSKIEYYMPHHAILRPGSITTKLRTVFDASCKTSSGVSLNDILMVGPTIQEDLFKIIIRFRQHKFVITADIAKMYRQIRIDPDDADLQRILWRENNNEELKTYRLLTVTYGTASAPYMATRCLRQLSIDEAEKCPAAAPVVIRDFYMDDLISGGDDINEVLNLQHEVTLMLESAGLEIHKWCSNSQIVLDCIGNDVMNEFSMLKLDYDDTIKTLGVFWHPKKDLLMYKVKPMDESEVITKRTILSATATVFDPFGNVGPVIVIAKLIIQKLWKLQLNWDDPVPDQLQQLWIQYRNELSFLNELKIERRIVCDDPVEIQLHGFSDASEIAYGACIYMRSLDANGNILIRLLCAKSKVAPLKNVSLPRLELCSALLLAKLFQNVKSSLTISFRTFLWSDSTIALCWLSKSSCTWNTFVANRVSEVQRLTETAVWRHISGKDNPADIISRGICAEELLQSILWWNGPAWLANSEREWPETLLEVDLGNIPEARKVVMLVRNDDFGLIDKFSSLGKLKRVMAYVQRFLNNANPKKKKNLGSLSVIELHTAQMTCIKLVQQQHFPLELKCLNKKMSLQNKSKLLTLNPTLDEAGVIRVGGRLGNSPEPLDKKYPIILPSSSHLTKLIAHDEHIHGLHQGPQALLYSLRQRYWPLSGRRLTRQIVHQCVCCFRAKPRGVEQLMGSLPKERVEPVRPFVNCGIDFCGPFNVRPNRLRKVAAVKAYIAVFVCLSTKAIHLELVGDLTSESFIGALHRFWSRRGKSLNIFSDNATNFAGADRELQELHDLFTTAQHQEVLNRTLGEANVTWHFIPPRAPNFGGLWEAGVKSVKSHLKKVMGDALLTYEEMYTVLTQIEACLNSRPLCPMSEDVNDLNALSPGHFLIGDCLTTNLEPDLTHLNINRLSRWQRVQEIMQHFFKRWSQEYLVQLQNRPKWKKQRMSIEVGDLVLVKDELMPPLKWALARVIETHPGNDGLVRVVTLKTAKGEMKRAISKICPLPTEEDCPEDHLDDQSDCKPVDPPDVNLAAQPDVIPDDRDD